MINPAGTPARLVQAAFARRFILVACPHLIDEFDTVLRRPAFRRYATLQEVNDFVFSVIGVAEEAPDPPDVQVSRDPKDDYLVALAGQEQVDRLVTGDADLHAVVDPPCPVCSPRSLLEEFQLGG